MHSELVHCFPLRDVLRNKEENNIDFFSFSILLCLFFLKKHLWFYCIPFPEVCLPIFFIFNYKILKICIAMDTFAKRKLIELEKLQA